LPPGDSLLALPVLPVLLAVLVLFSASRTWRLWVGVAVAMVRCWGVLFSS
jgi:hypothetical protein